MGFNDLVWSVFQGYKEHNDQNYEKRFRKLNMTMDCWIGEAYTGLLEVRDLNDLLSHAKTKEHHNAILEHLYRHDATRVDCYRNIERKIIDHYWEG